MPFKSQVRPAVTHQRAFNQNLMRKERSAASNTQSSRFPLFYALPKKGLSTVSSTRWATTHLKRRPRPITKVHDQVVSTHRINHGFG